MRKVGLRFVPEKFFFRDSPVLEASYCVNPFYLDDPCDFYLRSRLKDAVKFIYGDTLYSGDVLKELSLYKSRSTRELQSPECLDDAKQLPALGWWKVWGYQFPHLQVVAKRLSAIHQKWSCRARLVRERFYKAKTQKQTLSYQT